MYMYNKYLRVTPPAAGPLDVDSGLLTSVLAAGELGTYRPRFSFLRNVSENRVKIKDVFISRPAPSTEFRRGSCCHSQIGWRPYICKVLPGCVITHSKTPQEYTYCSSALGTWDRGGVGMQWGWVGMGAWNDCLVSFWETFDGSWRLL